MSPLNSANWKRSKTWLHGQVVARDSPFLIVTTTLITIRKTDTDLNIHPMVNRFGIFPP